MMSWLAVGHFYECFGGADVDRTEIDQLWQETSYGFARD
jgi:hypothetical protein